jgi:hypothetical protein
LTSQAKYDIGYAVKRTYSTGQAAKMIGVGRVTLQRWLIGGRVAEPKKLTTGGVEVRIWTDRDVERPQTEAENWEARKGDVKLLENEPLVKQFRDWLRGRSVLGSGFESTDACVAVLRKFGDSISPTRLSQSTAAQLRTFREGHQSREELLSFGIFEQYCRKVLKKGRGSSAT